MNTAAHGLVLYLEDITVNQAKRIRSQLDVPVDLGDGQAIQERSP